MAEALERLISIVKKLPFIKQRGVAAIIGATVADAATRPFHWVYDQERLDKVMGNATVVEFWPESISPFYTVPLGSTSSYNDAMQVSLMSIKENNGVVDVQNICEAIKKKFEEGTPHYEAYLKRKAKYDSENRSTFPGPIEGPWIQAAVLKFLENYASKSNRPFGDKENKENDGFCLSIPIIAQVANFEDVWSAVSPVTSIFTTDEITTKMYHLITILLSGYIQELKDPIENMKNEINSFYPEFISILNDVEENKNQPYISTVAKYGKACSLPGSFIGSYLTILNTNSFADAVRLNITAGGCNCSRANIIGSCFGAKYGIDGIPKEWMRKVTNIENVIEAAIEIVNK